MTAPLYELYLAALDIAAKNNADFILGPAAITIAGVPLVLTGAAGKMQVRTSPYAPTALIDFDVSPNTLVFGGSAGANTFTAKCPLSVIQTIPVGKYVYDLIITIGGVSQNWMTGTFEVCQGVSR